MKHDFFVIMFPSVARLNNDFKVRWMWFIGVAHCALLCGSNIPILLTIASYSTGLLLRPTFGCRDMIGLCKELIAMPSIAGFLQLRN